MAEELVPLRRGLAAISPEVAVAGFSRNDGTVAFYAQAQALCRDASMVLDVGAGRGAWAEDPVPFRRDIHDLRAPSRTVIGIDVDEAVLGNPAIDRASEIEIGSPWPIEPGSIDVAVADWVIEHVSDPGEFVGELARVLAPGGWFCARTTNRRGYIALGARAIPKRGHGRVLGTLQPDASAEDKFPTVYRMNTTKALRSAFDASGWDLTLVPHHPEPTYTGDRPLLTRFVNGAQRFIPSRLGATIFVFAQKR